MRQNSWLAVNKKEIERVKRIMIESEYVPELQSLPLRSIQKLLQGAEAEIRRLHSILNEKTSFQIQ